MIKVETIVLSILLGDPTLPKDMYEGLISEDAMERRHWRIEFPRWIRNRFKLWEADLGGEHPDDFSARVVELLKTKYTTVAK